MMEKYNKITEHELFKQYLIHIEETEADRIYCRHGITHLLDVARIAYIINLEEQLGFSKDMIYGMALLHDIGKPKQYEDKTPHEITGARLAEVILPACGYDERETELMVEAIRDHRRGPQDRSKKLSVLLYEADKKSRMCLFCQAKDDCNWQEETKNQRIWY